MAGAVERTALKRAVVARPVTVAQARPIIETVAVAGTARRANWYGAVGPSEPGRALAAAACLVALALSRAAHRADEVGALGPVKSLVTLALTLNANAVSRAVPDADFCEASAA